MIFHLPWLVHVAFLLGVGLGGLIAYFVFAVPKTVVINQVPDKAPPPPPPRVDSVASPYESERNRRAWELFVQYLNMNTDPEDQEHAASWAFKAADAFKKASFSVRD